jgi:hypothetical protein
MKVKSIKVLDHGLVFCQADCCDTVAKYLFIETGPLNVYSAYCEVHADRCAREASATLPDRTIATGSSHLLAAS